MFVLLEPLLVGVASLVASAAAGYVAGSVLVFLVAAVAGFVWGLGWFFLVGGVILRRWPNVASPVGFYGGPVVAVSVAAIAAAGYWWVVGLGLGVTIVLVVVFWLRGRLRREPRSEGPMSRAQRLSKLVARRDAGFLTPDQYEAIKGDIMRMQDPPQRR